VTRILAGPRTLLLSQLVILLLIIPLQSTAEGPLPSAVEAIAAVDTRESSALNVSIVVFDPGVPGDESLHRDLRVFPRIREIEAKFLPFVLREALTGTNEWGAVRVVALPDEAAELLVSGAIIRSDGETLELNIRVVDASGRVWFDKAFGGVTADDYEQGDSEHGGQGNQQLYHEIAQELQMARAQLDGKTLTSIVDISLLRYATQLAPSAFGDHLDRAADGTFIIQRLPARNDPMLGRIERIRGAEYVITDAVDEKFQELNTEIVSIYDMWREYRRKVVAYQTQNANWLQNTKSDAPRGSYEAMKSLYDNYKLERITEQEQDRLAVAFNNEVSPTVAAIEVRVGELEGWADEQYAEWRRLLEEIFELETGLEQ